MLEACRIAGVVQKVIVYIVRHHRGVTELLVFEHVGADAGVQVPKGTVEPGESPEHAAIREVCEETGLRVDGGLRHIGTLTRFGEEWSFFAVTTDAPVPDVWVHRVGGVGEDVGMRFRYCWLPLNPVPNLAGNQGDGLPFLKNLVR